jgi:hypothetical protein
MIQISSLISAQVAESDFQSAGILLDIYTLGIGFKQRKDTSAHFTAANMLSRDPSEASIGQITLRDISSTADHQLSGTPGLQGNRQRRIEWKGGVLRGRTALNDV